MQSADENVFSLCDSEGNTVEIRSVLDSYGYSHDIAKVLGQGGQGVVCLTRNPEIVIKFALDSKGRLICRDKNKEAFSFDFKKESFRPDPVIVKSVFRLGIPIAIQSSAAMVSSMGVSGSGR